MSDTMDDMEWNAASRRVWAEHDKTAHGNTSPSACSAWDSWTHKALEIELTDRLLYVFGRTDGTMKFPNSNEGDLLKLTWAMLRKQN